MIDIKELRVGAHVEYGGKRCLVTWIFGKAVDLRIGSDNKTISSASINPISITAELLQELGFENISCDCSEAPDGTLWRKDFYDKRYMYLKILDDYNVVRVKSRQCAFDILHFKYLHELEAFVYLTTKQELIKED